MRRLFAPAAAALFLSLLAAPPAQAFDWKDVREMHLAGISESLIIEKIRYSGEVFHLESEEIVALKKAGVSDEVISAMLRTEAREEDGEERDYGPYPRSVSRVYVGFGLGYHGPHYPYYGPYYGPYLHDFPFYYPYRHVRYYPYYGGHYYPRYGHGRHYSHYGRPRYHPPSRPSYSRNYRYRGSVGPSTKGGYRHR